MRSDIETVRKRINQMYKHPKEYYGVKKEIFMMHAYSRWAAEEIIRILKENPNTSSVDLVEHYRDKMDYFAASAHTAEANFMFSVACDTATDILDCLLR